MGSMFRTVLATLLVLGLAGFGGAQQTPSKTSNSAASVPQTQAPATTDQSSDERSAGQDSIPDRQMGEESSSAAHRVDITPPKNDAKDHPFSADAVEETEPPTDVQEFHPWDPHRAAKNLEVGEFYLKRKNYKAAESRFREALIYKSDYAIAKYRLGEALEKEGHMDEAKANYEGYLKTLPHGPLSEDAEKAIARLSKEQQSKK